MNRRDFLKTTSGVLATTALSDTFARAKPAGPGGRMVLPMNRNWKFKPAKVTAGTGAQFDDSGFETVVIPHTNVQLPWHNFDDKSYEFVSTYRRRFRLPEGAAEGKRVFVDFEGSMTATRVWINGMELGEYRGGFTPFTFELTPHLVRGGENVLVAEVDSTERADIPPFGYEIDYMTFGGLYREVSLRIVPEVYLDNILARPSEVLSGRPSLDVDCFLSGKPGPADALSLAVELLDGAKVIARGEEPVRFAGQPDPQASLSPTTPAPTYESTEIRTDPAMTTVKVRQIGGVKLWDLQTPHLYTVRVRLRRNGQSVDEDTRRIGFREATFTDHGFSLNGRIVKLRGLDRHQTFPFVGQAMPARVQRRDAYILRKELHCNIVRTSHYPQSRHFLDACDELGLLVLEEIPGWQHIGPEPWKQISIDNVGRMIRRDWNHPSIVLWGVRINESQDDHSFYSRTNALAHALDPTRQTGGIRYLYDTELLEDVMTMNDFGFPLRKPNHPRYLNTEFVGHTYPTKSTDDDERQREHTLRHARIHNQLASDPQYAGGIGWCAFDYNTHANFGSGDRICYHGVSDIFREAKPAAGYYKSQCDPEEEVVLEPAFHWARGDESVGLSKAVFCSNCDHLKLYANSAIGKGAGEGWQPFTELDPDHTEFQYLRYPPFVLDLEKLPRDNMPGWGDLRIDGYLHGKKVISKTLSGAGVDREFMVVPDDQELIADGADTTRVVLRVTDEFGAVRTYANDAIQLRLEGPAELIGDNPFSLVGGTGAVWVRAGQQPGKLRLTATHPRLGSKTVELSLGASEAEKV